MRLTVMLKVSIDNHGAPASIFQCAYDVLVSKQNFKLPLLLLLLFFYQSTVVRTSTRFRKILVMLSFIHRVKAEDCCYF